MNAPTAFRFQVERPSRRVPEQRRWRTNHMKCFTHGDVDAVGFCRCCGRALCHSCSAEVAGVLCCAGRCEASVKTVQQMHAEAKVLLDDGDGSIRRLAWLMSVLSVLFLGLGIAGKFERDTSGVANLMLLLGLGAAVRVCFAFARVKRLRKGRLTRAIE